MVFNLRLSSNMAKNRVLRSLFWDLIIVYHGCMTDVTQILNQVELGDPQATDQLLALLYDDLRRSAERQLNNEAAGQSLQATALVHEAYVRLIGGDGQWNSRGHFFAAAGEAMRRILVERARKRHAKKRGGGIGRADIELDRLAGKDHDEKLLALNEALEKLEQESPDKAELVKLRFFAGLTIQETAAALGISTSTADRHWSYSRAWLQREMKH